MKKLAMLVFILGFFATAGFSADGEYIVEEPAPAQEESQWERFKAGAKEAGGAVAEGTKRTARKVGDGAEKAGDAIVRGSKKAGHAIADGYEDVKDYVKEKVD